MRGGKLRLINSLNFKEYIFVIVDLRERSGFSFTFSEQDFKALANVSLKVIDLGKGGAEASNSFN